MTTKVATMATSKRERQKAARRQKLEAMQRANKRRKSVRRAVIVVIVAILVVGTGALLFAGGSKTTPTLATTTTNSASGSTTTVPASADSAAQAKANAIAVAHGCPASTSTTVNTLSWKTAPPMTIDKSLTYYAHFVTTAGNFVVKLDAATAPITTNNFVFLAEHNFYKCVIFHRAIPGFMIQGGDPTGKGTGGPGYTIADEYPKVGKPTYPLYSIAMANTGSPHTGGSQFFIVTGSSGETLSNQYSLFGQVISGTSVVMKINDEGNPSASANGVPPLVVNRMLSVTISNSAS
jgi:cyclophilin family peptidyl-prolyl cis-trans isomerase